MRIAVLLMGLVTATLLASTTDRTVRRLAGEGAEGYRLELTSFTSSRPYALATRPLTLVGTVRNLGPNALPPEAVTLRMYAVNGLDYLEGATIVRLPAMEPGASATYRWKVEPTSPDAPLVAALVLERPEYLPQIRLLPIQHFMDTPPAFGTGSPPKPVPAAAASGASGWADNGMVRVRVLPTSSEMAAAFLFVKTAGAWRQTGLAMPLVELLSGEEAQEPWWEALKVKQCTATVDRNQAVLTVSGQIGVRWRSSLSFTVRKGSSVVDTVFQAAPRRDMLLHGIRPSTFLAGEGSFGAAASEVLDPVSVGGGVSSAVRWGNLTTGMIWPAEAPFAAWPQRTLSTPDGVEYRLIGAEFRTGKAPHPVPKGSAVRMRWRLYALSPSTTVRDALKVALPP